MPRITTADTPMVRKIRDKLRRLNALAARRVTLEFADGILTLRGQVPSFYTRQVFIHVGGRTPGVEAVIDELQVEA